jgi:hypothetical protein
LSGHVFGALLIASALSYDDNVINGDQRTIEEMQLISSISRSNISPIMDLSNIWPLFRIGGR